MKKLLFILFLFSVISNSSFSQKWKLTRYEAFIAVGAANYFGDIGGSAEKSNWYGVRDISITGTRPSLMVGARYKIKQDLNIKLTLSGLMLSGKDGGSKNEHRGFDFSSYGFEHTMQVEYAFIAEEIRQRSFALFNRRGMLNNFSKKSIYVFGGLGGLLVRPVFNGTPSKVDMIQEKFIYTATFPIGVGLKMIYNNSIALGVEFGGRYTLTDYLDGMTSTYSNFNDIYYFTSVNLVYRIKTSRKGYPILFKNY